MKEITYSAKSEHYKACRTCEKRCEGCHDGCEEYAKEVILGAMLGAIIAKEAYLRNGVEQYHINKVNERKMSKHPENRYGRVAYRRKRR